MYPPPTRGSFSSRKRKIPGPIALLDNKSNQDHLESSWSSGGLNNQEDESAMEGVSQGADSAWWASGAWMSAWSVLGYPPMQEHPSEAHAAAMCEEYMGSPLRALAANHWERERSGVFLAVIGAVHHHTDKDCTVQLVDPTGRAQAYLHCNVVADAGPDLTTGAVVLIKKAALVHNRSEIGSWYLNVTPDNLMMLWPAATRFVPPPPTTALRRVGETIRRGSDPRESGRGVGSVGSMGSTGSENNIGYATTPVMRRVEGQSITIAASEVDSILSPKVSKPSVTINPQLDGGDRGSTQPSIQASELNGPFTRPSLGIAPTNSGNAQILSNPNLAPPVVEVKDDREDDGLLWDLTEDDLNASPPRPPGPRSEPTNSTVAPLKPPDPKTAPIAAAQAIAQALGTALPAIPFQSNDSEEDDTLLDDLLDP